MALAANIFSNYLQKLKMLLFICYALINISLAADSLLYNKERSKPLGPAQRNAPSKNHLKPSVN